MYSPRIGITTARLDSRQLRGPDFIGCRAAYCDEVSRAGGIPVLLPTPPSPGPLVQFAEDLDGIIFSGGEDISPARYGVSVTHPKAEISLSRDMLEFELLERARLNRKPVLGICRGMQLFGAAFGGMLHQYLPDDCQVDHMNRSEDRWIEIVHQLRLEDGLLCRLLGTAEIGSNSLHNQAISTLPPGHGLRVIARAEDGVIEAIEGEDPSWFIIGVEGHPEALCSTTEPRWQRLYDGFVTAARTWRERNPR